MHANVANSLPLPFLGEREFKSNSSGVRGKKKRPADEYEIQRPVEKEEMGIVRNAIDAIRRSC